MFRALIPMAGAILIAGQALAADWKKVVDPTSLNAMLDQDVIVLDIRSGKDFAKGHVPGAVNAAYGKWRGPKENPGRTLSDDALTALLQGLGIERDDRVVVTYAGKNATDFGSAARVYWTLKSAGLTEIAILNGGLKAWAKAGLPLGQDAATPTPSTGEYTLSTEWMIDRVGVQAVLDGSRDAIMVDARPEEFWAGDKKHAAAAQAGTLDGALNITHDTWFVGSKTEIVSGDDVLRIAKEAGYVPGETELVSFCNTGHWAATNWFALSELAGIEGVKLYPESMVGWTLLGGATVNGG
ncbi:MAG: rhodanese-like domain-containing protein [Pseudomonadota bacterium]